MGSTEKTIRKQRYFKKKYDNLKHFISYHYQINLIKDFMPKTILEVGIGNGLVSNYFKKMGANITTCDINPKLNPDRVGEITRLPFRNKEFDVVVAYEVMEHNLFSDFEKSLMELRRISKKFVIISLPYRNFHFEIVMNNPFKSYIISRKLDIPLFRNEYFNFYVGIPAIFYGKDRIGRHCWEIGLWGYSLNKIRKILSKHFKIIKEVRPILHSYNHFFVLKK